MTKSFLSCCIISITSGVNLCFDWWFSSTVFLSTHLIHFLWNFSLQDHYDTLRGNSFSLLAVFQQVFSTCPFGLILWNSYLEVLSLSLVWYQGYLRLSEVHPMDFLSASWYDGCLCPLSAQAHLWTIANEPHPQLVMNSRCRQMPSPFATFSPACLGK